MTKILIHKGMDINYETSRGRTPLSEACRSKSMELIQYLLDKRVCLSYVNKMKKSTMRIAAEWLDAESMKVLEEHQKREIAQASLFCAIGCADFDAAMVLVAGGDRKYQENHLNVLLLDVDRTLQESDAIQDELKDHLDTLNESISLREEQQSVIVQLVDSIEYTKGLLALTEQKRIALKEEKMIAEAKLVAEIAGLTAKGIAQALNEGQPTAATKLVFKAVCLLNGVFPKIIGAVGTAAMNYSERDWWKASQALMMDRGFLNRLKDYAILDVSSDAMIKVRRECFKDPYFPDKAVREGARMDKDANPDSKRTVTESLAIWVHGVELQERCKHETKRFLFEEEDIREEIMELEAELKTAQFNIKSVTRSLPARQQEVENVLKKEKAIVAQLAMHRRRVEVCRLLEFPSRAGHTAFSFAAACGEIEMIDLLLNHGANPGLSDRERIYSAKVLQFVIRHHLWRCKKKNSQNRNSAYDITKEIAYVLALRPMVKKLIRIRRLRRLPIHEAAYNGHTTVVKRLIEAGVSPMQRTYLVPLPSPPGIITAPPVSHGAFSGMLLHLIDPPIVLAESIQLGRQRGECAAFRVPGGWDEQKTLYDEVDAAVKWILLGNSKQRDKKRQDILQRKKLLRVAQELDLKGKAMQDALSNDDFHTVDKLLIDGAYADYETTSGLTALMVASSKEVYVHNDDNEEVLAVNYLLDRNKGRPMPNFESTHGITALQIAIRCCTLKCAAALLAKGAEVNYTTRKAHQTALMVAVTCGKPEAVRFLLRHNSNIMIKVW